MLASLELRSTLRATMQRGATASLTDDEFNSLALQIFQHQFELNDPYRKYCERRGRTPATVMDWHEIPAVPTAAFKQIALVAGNPADAQLTFKTSGTTRGAERRGVHHILDRTLYESSLLPTFRSFVLHDLPRMRMISLIPPALDQPESSLSYMASQVVHEFATADSAFVASAHTGLDVNALRDSLARIAGGQEPVCLLGTSLAFMHFLEAIAGSRFQLPAGSRLMDTGGFKGERRVIAASELRELYRETLALPAQLCINEYGMTELCSQYYDARVDDEKAVKRGPGWLRARVVDADTLKPVARGAVGILQHFDLANLDSVSAVLTEDLAYEVEDGFVLLGRVPGATPRGCSIAMDILLSDAKQ